MQKDIEKQRKPILRKTSKYLRIPHFELKTEKSNMIKTNMMEKNTSSAMIITFVFKMFRAYLHDPVFRAIMEKTDPD